MEKDKSEHQSLSYGVYVVVWLSLLIFTGLTTTVGGIELRNLAVFVALLIAIVKTSLVVTYFMNLKNEDRMFKIMLLFALITLGVILSLTYADTMRRGYIL